MQSDKRLLKLFRRGVGPAFDELVSRYRAPLVGYAGAIVGRDRAEDVVQDSLIKAHKALLSEQDIEPKPWLYRVVRNTALNDVRDNKKHGHDELDETTVGIEQPQQVAERRAELAGVVAAISDLPEAQRKALIGRELSGFSHEEIASELRVSTGATKQLIHRARLNVRNAMGALIPIPLIAWLAASGSSAAGGAAGAAGGAAASGGGAVGAGTTAAVAGGGGAAAGGALAGLGSAGLAKVAVVAVIAGGGVAGGVAVKRSAEQPATADSPALEASSDSGSANGTDAIDGAGGDRSGSRQGEGSGSGSGSGAGSAGGGDPSEEETLDGSEDESPRGDDGSGGGTEDKGGSGGDKGGSGGDKGGGDKKSESEQ